VERQQEAILDGRAVDAPNRFMEEAKSQRMTGVCQDYLGAYLNRTWRYYESYLRRYKNHPRRILDIGSGLGLFLECCRQHGIDALGLEYNKKAVDDCVGRGFQVLQHDISKPFTGLADSSFDAVFCFQVIEHLHREDQINVIRESYRVLRIGGQAMFDSPCKHYFDATLAPSHVGLLTPKELAGLAADAGFKSINLGYNYPQYPPELPKEVVDDIWQKYHPDILSQTATILATK
jgi:SAM-dependent methyltransferase